MKKKTILTAVVLAATAIGLSIWLQTRHELLGNLNHRYATPETSTASFSFAADAGDEIKFSFASSVKGGDLNILLYDPAGTVVGELPGAKELETFAILEQSGSYTLAAQCEDFVGSFRVKVYAWD